MNTMQQQQRPTNNPPIFIGQGQNRTQISSESSEWGGDEDENFLFNVEEEYIASQTASKQATTSHRPAPPVLQRLGPARQPVRQLHPGPPAQTVFSTNRPQQAPRSTYPARPQMQLSANNLRPTSQFPAPRPLFQPQASQIIPRATYVPSQAVRHVPHQPQISQQPSKKKPENMQEALQQLADLEKTAMVQKGEISNVRGEAKRKEEEIGKLKREFEASRKNAQQELNHSKEQHRIDQDRLQTELNFKNHELTEVFNRISRRETDLKADGAVTSNGFPPDLRTPQKRLAPPDRGNFPTTSAFYDTSDSPRIKRLRKDGHPEREKVLISKEIQTDIVSTGATSQPERPLNHEEVLAQDGREQPGGHGAVGQNGELGAEAVPEPRSDGPVIQAVPTVTQQSSEAEKDTNTIRSFKIVHDLNDSRPYMDEMFTLAVLLQPPPIFEHSSSFELDLDRKKQIDLQLGRSGKLPKKVVKEELQAILTSSKSGTSKEETFYPPHIVAQEAIALFCSADKRVSTKNIYNLILGVLIPVLANHLRQYASFLHNLSALANAGSLNKSTSTSNSQFTRGGGGGGQLGEVTSLTVYFSSLMANSSTSNLKFVEALERNTKLTLIVLKKLLTFCPELHKFVMQELKPKAVYSDLATVFQEMKVFAGDRSENEQPGTEAENAGQLTEDSPATSSDETSAQEWLQVQEKLSAKYRLDGAAQEQAMVRLTKTPEALKTASAFRLLLLLFDPTQFKIFQKDILALAASALTALTDSVPIDSEDAHQIADRLLSDEVFINYLASAGGSEVTLEPAISLLSVLLKWTWCCPRLCTGDEETCPLYRLYLNVFTIPQLRQRSLTEQAELHKQMLDCLFDISLATDAGKKSLLSYPERHCVGTVFLLFMEILHSYVWFLNLHRETTEVPLETLASFKDFVYGGVLWLYYVKNSQNSLSAFEKMSYVVDHYLQEIVVLLHDEDFFEYPEDFRADINKMFEDVVNGKISLAPTADQQME